MKKTLNQTLEEDVNERNTLTRKIYRYISEAVKKVDEGTSRSKTISDLFTPSLEVNRQKLRENCEKLIFADPLLYGRKAQELLWRKGYYEAVATSKRLRQSCKDQEQLVLTHIDGGIGHYHNLISKVQHEMGINISALLDYPQTEIVPNKQSKKQELKEFVKSFVQTCLVYLGDLCRYKSDYDDVWAYRMSYRYYMQAVSVDANIGMPYNQLGTLHTGRNHHLDSASYYIVCLLSDVPFEGAEGNLTRIFDKSNKVLENSSQNPDIIDQQDSIKIMLCRFLSLVEHWFLNKPIINFNDVCTSVLYDIKECLRYQPLMTPEESKNSEDYVKYSQQNELSPDYMSCKLINKMVIILLLLINKLHKENSNLVVPLKTFTLAVLSQLLHKLHSDFVTIGFDRDVVSKIIEGFKEKIKNQRNTKTSKMENGFHNHEEISEVGSTSKKESDDISSSNAENRKSVVDSELTAGNENEGNMKMTELEIKNDFKRGEKLINGDLSNKVEKQSKSKKSSVLLKLRRRKRCAGSEDSSDSSEENDDTDDNNTHSDNKDSDEEDTNGSDEDVDSYSTTSSDDEEELENNDKSNKDDPLYEEPEDKETMLEVRTSPVDQNMNETGEDNPAVENDMSEIKEEAIVFNEKMFREYLEHNDLLVSLHLILNWLFGEPELILSFGSNGRPMFLALVNVLNVIHGQMLPKLSWNNYCLSNQFHPTLKSFHELFFSLKFNGFRKMPVAEDYEVKNLEICSKGLKYVDWNRHSRTTLSNVESNTIRLMKIVDFGAFIVKLNVGIVFNRRLKLYLLKKASAKKPNYKKYGKGPRDVHTKTQRSYKPRNTDLDKSGTKQTSGSLMKNLGRLWLSEQVRALESEVGSKKQPNLPAYVILDADALCQQTHLVKQLVASKKLIVLIPTIVLHTMDELKKESGAARSAIRWLENQLSVGSRFIRAQRPNENTPIPCIKYPKKMHRHVQNFIQIVEFCHFFLSNDTGESSVCQTNMNGSGDSNSNDKPTLAIVTTKNNQSHANNNLVVLLTGSSNLYTEQKDFSYKGVAHSAGITMESIQDFCFKWRHCFGKGTKKR